MPVSRPNLIVCLGLTLLLGACGEKETIESQRPRVVVQVAETNDYAAAATLTGDIQARVQTELSFRVGGKLVERKADVGDRVGKGDVLAVIDPGDLSLQAQAAKAQLAAADADLVRARGDLARYAKLVDQQLISRSTYDAQLAAWKAAEVS